MRTTGLLSCVLLLALLLPATSAPSVLTVGYCGFSGEYCGESINDDVYSRAANVLLSYAVVGPNGAVIVDADHYPKAEAASWRATGKRLMLSVGGPGNTWANAFASESNRQTFISTLANAVRTYSLDGVDLDIEDFFSATPRRMAETINDLRRLLNSIGRKYISLTADCITIYQGSPVPDAEKAGQGFNYLVPLAQLADSAIDFYHAKAYSNWYDGYEHTSLAYLQDVYLNWRNLYGLCQGCQPIPNFKGIAASKLLIGLLAAPEARAPTEYKTPTTVRDFKNWLAGKGYDLYGFHLWNSYWDRTNGNQISQAVTA